MGLPLLSFLVIIIIGILSGISAPSLKNSFNSFKLNSSAREIALLIRQLQAKAVYQAEPFFLQINTQKGIFAPMAKVNNYWQALKEKSVKPIIIDEVIRLSILPQEKERINFYPDGSIDKIEIKLENPSYQKIVLTVEDIIGNVKISQIQQ